MIVEDPWWVPYLLGVLIVLVVLFVVFCVWAWFTHAGRKR